MDNHSGDESVLPSEMHDTSIVKNECEASGGIQNGAAVTENDDKCEMEGICDTTAAIKDKSSVQDNYSETDDASNVVGPKGESISDETGTLFKTDTTNEFDMKTDDYNTMKEETNIESETAPGSVPSDCLAVQSTTECDGESSVSKEPVSSIDKEPVSSHDENQSTGLSKTSIIMLDDEEDEEERHERFLRIDTVEKPFGDGRIEAGEKMSAAMKRRMNKDDNGDSASSSTTSAAVVPPKNARLVFRNLPMDYTTNQMKELLQEKLPSGVLLGEFPSIIEGRAVVEVTPSNTAEQAARLLHDIMMGDCKISVRKLITVDTADTVVPTPAPTPTTPSIEMVQATCDREGCVSLVMQGDVHTQCCSHSICFSTGVFDPASCPHCLSVHARATAGELAARRLWRNRMQRMRKKRLQWVSEEVRLRFPHPDAPPRGNAVADAALAESTGLGIQASTSTAPTEGAAPDDSNPVVVEGGDDAGGGLRVRDRSAERNKRAAEVAELGALVVSSKLEMQRRSKGKEYRVTINNISYGFSLKEMLKMLQDTGPVVFLMPRFGSLVVEFETAEAATTCHQRLDKTTFMTRKLSLTLHGEAGRGQQQQTVPTSPTTGDSSSPNLKGRAAGEAVEPTPAADGVKLSAELQARLSTAAELGGSTDSFVGPVAPTSVKDRLVMPGSSNENFGFSTELLESLNITMPMVKELSVSNLNERATSADVRELFNVAGCVMGVQYDRARGTAIVEMRHPVEAVQAISLLHAQFYHNKPLTVRLHRANDVLPQGGTTPPFPKGLQTIGKRLPIDKKVMAALQVGLTTPVQPMRQRQQKMNSVEKRLQNNVPLPAKRPQMGGSVAQRNMNGSTPADNYKNNSNMGKQQNNGMGQQKIIPTTMLSNAPRPGGPQGLAGGGGAPFTPQKQDHARGAVGQNNSAGNKRGNRKLKRQAGSESDFGNPAKRKNPYWGNYRGPNATGNNAINSVANDGNFQKSTPNSGSKFSSNYGQGNNSGNNNSGNNNSYSTLNRYTSSTSNTTPMGQQYSNSSTSGDWNTGNSSTWNDNYSNWNWQQPNTGDTAAYGGGGGGGSSSTTTAGYGSTTPTGYSDNTSAGGYGGANASYAAGAVRPYNNTTSNIATPSYGSGSSSVPGAGYGGSVGPATASYGSSASTGYGMDGSSASYSSAPPSGGVYSGSSGAYSSGGGGGGGYYDSSGAPEAGGAAGAQPTAWAGQPTAKVPKYNSDGSFAGFS